MNVIAAIRHRYGQQREPERSQGRLELLLLGLLLLVTLQLLWWGIDRFTQVSVTPVSPAKDSLQVVDARATGAISAPQSLQVQSRPLFWASRRPVDRVERVVATAGATQKKPARRLEDLQVTGALGAGAQGKAIVMYKEKRMRLGIGDSVGGWTLQSVGLGEVVFVSAGARDVRRLMPLPVVAASAAPVQEPQASPRQAPGRVQSRGAPPRGPAAQPAQQAQKKNDKKEGALSLGG